MTRRAKIAVALTAALGLLVGSQVTTLIIPGDGGCVTSDDGTTTTCTLDSAEPWRLLVGGVPFALALGGLAVLLIRRRERRAAR